MYGRDVESTVEEIHKILDEKLKLPAGYYYTYGRTVPKPERSQRPTDDCGTSCVITHIRIAFFTFRNIKLAAYFTAALFLLSVGECL